MRQVLIRVKLSLGFASQLVYSFTIKFLLMKKKMHNFLELKALINNL
jgi:hypothetical protein